MSFELRKLGYRIRDPEAATMLLLGTGLISLAAFGRKKFKEGKLVK